MAVPELWILAGPNGAGKTTSAQRKPIAALLPGVRFLNPDDRTLEKLRARGYQGFADSPPEVQRSLFIESANEVSAELEDILGRNEPIGVETVLSSDKYRDLVERVRARGGRFYLLYVALASAQLAVQRVAARFRRGGHDVPSDRIVERWQRSLDCLGWFALQADSFWVVDNSVSNPLESVPFLAFGSGGRLEFLADTAFPELVTALHTLPRSA